MNEIDNDRMLIIALYLGIILSFILAFKGCDQWHEEKMASIENEINPQANRSVNSCNKR